MQLRQLGICYFAYLGKNAIWRLPFYLHIYLNMQFGMCHSAHLLKYATWHQKKLTNTHFYYFTFGAP